MEQVEGKKLRLTMEVTPELKAVLEDLREGQSIVQTLRQSIALLKTAKDARARGESLALIDADGRVTARLVGF